jgi:hypothetical protein
MSEPVPLRSPNESLQATPGLVSLFFFAEGAGAPELWRWARER